MKLRVLFQILVSVSVCVSTTSYGQAGMELKYLKVKKEGYDLQGTLQVEESYDKQTKMLTLTIKNEYKHDLLLFHSRLNPKLYVSRYYRKDGKDEIDRIPISVSGDIENRKKIINPDSTHVISIDCKEWSFYEQVSFEGAFTGFLVDKKEEVIASGTLYLEGKRFDL